MLPELVSSEDDPHFAAFSYSLETLVTDLRYDFGKMLVLAGLTPLICLLIIATNVLLLYTICRTRQLRDKPFNLYIASLCVSDLLAVEWIVPYLIFYVTRDATLWNTNMHAFFLVAAFLNSMYTVVALSVHRYRGIVQPLKRGFTRRQTASTIAYIWVSVLVFTAIYAGIKYHCYPDVHEIRANGTCPKVRIGEYNAFGFMHLLIIIFGYFIPILVSAVLFAITAYKLRWAGTGHAHAHSEQSARSKARAFNMVVALFALFVVFWTPYWGFMIYWHRTRRDPTLYFRQGSLVAKRANFLHNAAIFLALCYSWANMFVYMYFGRELRGAVCSVMRCRGAGRAGKAEVSTSTSGSGGGSRLAKLRGGGGGTDTSGLATTSSSTARIAANMYQQQDDDGDGPADPPPPAYTTDVV